MSNNNLLEQVEKKLYFVEKSIDLAFAMITILGFFAGSAFTAAIMAYFK